MFPSLQPSRPRLPPAYPISTPMNQQPTRESSSLSPSFPNPPTFASAPVSGPVYQPPRAPRTQIEAMPPFAPRTMIQVSAPTPPVVFDASMRHPVFFTDRLKRAPAGVGTGGGSWVSPVAHGYVFNDGVRRRVEGEVKL